MKQLIFVLLAILALRFYFFYSTAPELSKGENIEFEALLLKEPKLDGKYQRLTANLERGERVYVYAPRFPAYHFGQELKIFGSINSQVINNNRTTITMFSPNIKMEQNDDNFKTIFIKPLLAVASFIRQNVNKTFKEVLSKNEASLMLGIVFGIDEEMSKSYKEVLQKSGVLHVVAASGMNVTMVGGFLSSAFLILLKRQYALILSIAGIFIYSLLAGFEPSITRASIMAAFAISAQIIGRQALAGYLILITALIMLFISPYLLFDVSFQLSFLATIGLMYISPIVVFHVSKVGFVKNFLFTDLVTTVSAQLAVLPILLGVFGSYSPFSIIANVLVLWTIPVLMILGGLAFILGLFFMPIASILLFLCLPFLIYFEAVTSFFAKGQQIAVSSLPASLTIGYYFILTSLILFLKKRI